jgi:DNA-binding protein WhiA
MSFSSEVREELFASPVNARHCLIAEMYAMINASGMETSAFADTDEERASSLLKSQCCKRSYIRGSFIACGVISDPIKTYHLEFTFQSGHDGQARFLSKLIRSFGPHTKTVRRGTGVHVYLKDSGAIAEILNIIGAHKSLMRYENIRILKEMRNTVNRKVNCETANLNKTVGAAVGQLEAIQFISDSVGLSYLPKTLEEVARLRLKYESASLQEIGGMLPEPVGKSGVNHRLRKISEIAETLKESM